MEHSYRSLSGESEALIKEKSSKFIGYSRSVQTVEDAESFLSHIQSLHPKARHHCYAWRIGHPDIMERANDDGEPSGTAGRPILGQLIKQDVTDAMIVVVRYFGGTLLGTSGLIQAYKECAEATLAEASIIKIIEKDNWVVDLDFAIVHVLEEWAPRLEFEILERMHINDRMQYHMEIDKSISEISRTNLIAKLLDGYPEEVDPKVKQYDQFSFCPVQR